MAITLTINGQPRCFETLSPGDTLHQLIAELALKSDRIAIEHNSELAPRTSWPTLALKDSDRLEIVHFVGGGLSPSLAAHPTRYKQGTSTPDRTNKVQSYPPSV